MNGFDKQRAIKYVINSGKHLFIATDLLKEQGLRATSKTKGYSGAKTVLKRLEKEGYLYSRFFPEVSITVYWKIP